MHKLPRLDPAARGVRAGRGAPTRRAALTGLAAVAWQFALLTVLAATVGLGAAGWATGAVCAAALAATLVTAIVTGTAGPGGVGAARRDAPGPARRRGVDPAGFGGVGHVRHGGLGPADRVTAARAVLIGAVTALVADSLVRPISVPAFVGLAALALVLDAVDGRVARGTATTSAFGARFDMETDAFLIFVLSVYVAPRFGLWVLAIGLARYVFVAAGRLLLWLRETAPPRYWAKVVAAVQGIVLTVAASGVFPRPATVGALVIALALLAESFGHETWWLWRHRKPGRREPARSTPLTAAAFVLVWFVLVLPPQLSRVTPADFIAIPLTGLVIVACAVFLPAAGRRWAAAVFGVLLGLLAVLKTFDAAFYAIFDREFDPLSDWYYLRPGLGVLVDTIGRVGAAGVTMAAVLFTIGALVLMLLAVGRIMRASAARRRTATRGVVAVGVVWAVCAAFGVQAGVPVASTAAAHTVYDRLHRDIADRRAFAAQIAGDPAAGAPSGKLLTGLRGKDVVVAVVESYGRSAVTGASPYAPGVEAVLTAGNTRLRAAGFTARSGFLTSPTFGGSSWLAHSTLESGLWVNSQQRYNQLLTSKRATLAGAFARAGWRTVSVVPADTKDWPEGSRFYSFDALYDSRNLGYRGPKFGYATMPDQYTLSKFRRLELAPSGRKPVMAEIDLVSSHDPWTPLPRMVQWNRVGDGSVFDPMPAHGAAPDRALSDRRTVRRQYGKSIQYSLTALITFMTKYPDPNRVLIVVGDHQPHSFVTGAHPSHDVPASIIAGDPAVLDAISGWNWQPGMLPAPGAPVWPMSEFRDKFLAAFSPRVSLPARAASSGR